SEDPQAFIAALGVERSKRWQQYDSIANYLEPNIKFQPGGLRDLEQAMFLLRFFSEGTSNAQLPSTLKVLESYRWTLALIRQVLQRYSSGDILVASEQFELA